MQFTVLAVAFLSATAFAGPLPNTNANSNANTSVTKGAGATAGARNGIQRLNGGLTGTGLPGTTTLGNPNQLRQLQQLQRLQQLQQFGNPQLQQLQQLQRVRQLQQLQQLQQVRQFQQFGSPFFKKRDAVALSDDEIELLMAKRSADVTEAAGSDEISEEADEA